MADTKITSLLTPQVTTNPATDVLPIVNIADTSMASSGSTRKITVNTLLGSGGTATLASATITGDLTVDTSTLKVDSANNRVGIGTASPAQSLDIASGNLQVRTGGTVFSDTFSNYGAALAINAAGSLPIRLQIAGTNAYEITSANIHQWSNVGGTSGTAMTLNSTGLGVGDAPAANSRLTIGSTNATGFQYALRTTGITTGRSQIYLVNTSGDLVAGIEGSTAGASVTGSAAYSAYIGTATSNPFYLVTGGTVRATVDATGNVGIGVAPLERLTVAGTGSFGGTGNTGIKFHSASPLSNNLCWLLANDQANSNVLNLYYYSAGVFSGRAFVVNQSGNFMVRTPSTPPTIPDNEMMVFNLTSNTNLRISVKGTDGTTRTANITLA